MSDPWTWSVSLGRWSGTQVRLHFLLLFFAGWRLLDALLVAKPAPGTHPFLETAAWLSLLLLALAIHELGHAAIASRLGYEVEDIRLWPLGNLVGPAPSYGMRTSDSCLIALAGPLTSLTMTVISWLGLYLAGAQPVLNPFGNALGTFGAPTLADGLVAPAFSEVWFVGWFGYLNWLLFLANLIPALPLDGGRVFRAALAGPGFGQPRDGAAGPLMARACVFVLVCAGLVRLVTANLTTASARPSGAMTLFGLALLIEMMVRHESRMSEEGYFDDGLFGYDFSEGYTSLENSTQKVRPRRESALRRWRRRRSEQRRLRRVAREAAEERRMDEILEKLHNQGRTSLTDEEHRFLIRVSAKYKNRPKHA